MEQVIKYFKFRHTKRTGRVRKVTYNVNQEFGTLKPISNENVTLPITDILNMRFEN